MTTQELQRCLGLLEAMPGRLESLIADLSPEERRSRPEGGGFSVLENVCHLQDIEREGYRARIHRLLEEDAPFMPDIDGSRLAIERSYNTQEMGAAMSGFRLSRHENVRVLSGISTEQLERRGMLEAVGPITLEELLRMMQQHDEGHLKEIEELREQLHRLR